MLPWFEAWGDIFVLARMSYPRPILRSAAGDTSALDDARVRTDFLRGTEPLNVLQTDKPLGQTVEEALAQTAHVPPEAIRSFQLGGTYYPSPGGVQEEVRSVHVAIDPLFVEERIANVSGFHTLGATARARGAAGAPRGSGRRTPRRAAPSSNVYELLLREEAQRRARGFS